MARRRKNPEDNKLPPRVSKTKYSYYLKTKDNKTIILGSLTMNMVELWSRYNHELDKQKVIMTFRKLWGMFISSPVFTEFAARTQTDYHKHGTKLLPVFGNVKVDNIKPEHIRKYMDVRGTQSKTQANHELSSMSRVYRWGYERGYAKINPCAGISRFKVPPRDIYTEDEEYYTIYKHARIAVKIAMEISYLCAARISDVLSLRHKQILSTGVFIQQGKTGKKQIKEWNDRLQDIISIATEQWQPRNKDSFVILSSAGSRYSYKTFNTHWLEAKKAAEIELGRELHCTFHDIKAKAISDYDGSSRDKQLFSGHKTESQVLIYDRKVQITPTLAIPKPDLK